MNDQRAAWKGCYFVSRQVPDFLSGASCVNGTIASETESEPCEGIFSPLYVFVHEGTK